MKSVLLKKDRNMHILIAIILGDGIMDYFFSGLFKTKGFSQKTYTLDYL